jgi:glycosyltransferase involved in cell wall biosynthesis
MRVLAINSMFANAMYRRCADELGAIDDVELTILTVDAWRMNGQVMRLDPVSAGAPYRTIIGKAGWRGFENRGFYRTGIARAIRASKPDVILLMEEPFSIFAAEILSIRAVLARQAPVVFFTWNNLSLEHFDYRPSIFYRAVARKTLSAMQYALTANSAGVNVLQTAGYHGPSKVVGYGVDTAAYSADLSEQAARVRLQLSIDPGDTVIGYVGRMLEMKGVDLLIESVSVLRKQHQNLKLLLVGSGDYEDSMRARAKELGLTEIMRHVSVVPHTQVPVYMQAMDILVLPSRRVGMWAEQFGRVLVEAMASGRIVVGSSSGAIPEVIGNGGFVFKENSAESLASTLTQALELTPAEKHDLSVRARNRAANNYSWRRFARDAYAAMNQTLENRAR